MKTLGLLLIAGITLAADKPGDDEAAKLAGTWTVTAGEAAGMKMTPKDLGIEQVVIKDDKITLKAKDGDGSTFTFTVDPSRKPMAMDWMKKDGSSIGGIYALEGDELKLCFPLVPKERKPGERLSRPDSFDTKGKSVVLVFAHREKP